MLDLPIRYNFAFFIEICTRFTILIEFSPFIFKLDGFIARKYNMKTMLGTVMDPAADKVLMTIMTITLAMKDLLPSEFFT
jgi:phosphatidylglycerophosphate synthase